jgi:hypothetical protein
MNKIESFKASLTFEVKRNEMKFANYLNQRSLFFWDSRNLFLKWRVRIDYIHAFASVVFTRLFEELFIIKITKQLFKSIFRFYISFFLHQSCHKILSFSSSQTTIMTRQHEKMSFEKKRFRNEARKNKKSKRNKKMTIKSSIVRSSKSSSKVISNEFSLSIAKTIIISNRTLNLAQQSDSRTRQLSNELKNMRQQQYQLRRMIRLTQSKHLTIDEIFRNKCNYDNEYDDDVDYNYDISEHTMHRVIFFISINVRIQEQSFIIQMTSQTWHVVNSLIVALNTIFDLKKFLFELETIIFEQNDIKKDISINQIRFDS